MKKKFASVALACLATMSSTSQSLAATLPTSGTCGILVTLSVPFGPNAPADGIINILGTITFTSATAGTMKYSATTIIYNPNPTNNQFGNETVTAGPLTSESFTVTAGTLPGASKLTTTSGQIFEVYPVNGGQTILVQGKNARAQGVCQF